MTLHANRITKGMRIDLEPDVYNLGEVSVTASGLMLELGLALELP